MSGSMSAVKRGIFVGLVLLGIITTLAPVVQADVLWVVPDNPTRYTDPNEYDFFFDETAIADVYMDSSYSGNVRVLNHAPAQDGNVAVSVYLKFFVHDDADADGIKNITVGTAKRIQPDSSNIEPNENSNPYVEPLEFTEVGTDPPVPEGWGVEYLIGDIPYHGGDDVGNPEDGDFNPDNADVYIEVPFTINFLRPPDVGFTLYVYAENDEEDVKTAYSHDSGFTHVPEFSTIAIPVAAVLGLLFFFNYRKKRGE